MRDQHAVLVVGAMGECHDSLARPRLRLPDVEHLGFDPQRVADEVRWAPPRTAMTMEFKEGRVTVAYDDAMTITAVTCG